MESILAHYVFEGSFSPGNEQYHTLLHNLPSPTPTNLHPRHQDGPLVIERHAASSPAAGRAQLFLIHDHHRRRGGQHSACACAAGRGSFHDGIRPCRPSNWVASHIYRGARARLRAWPWTCCRLGDNKPVVDRKIDACNRCVDLHGKNPSSVSRARLSGIP